MKQTTTYSKVATDMFWVQSIWTGGFLGILLLINIGKLIINGVNGTEADGFFNSIFIASNVYMLIIGMISIYFLPHFVGHGVTRKDYFIGSTIAAFALSIAIPLITFIISLLEKFILNIVDISYSVTQINDIDLDGNFIGDLVQSVILNPYVDPHHNFLLAIFVMSLNLFLIYLLGWFISAAFYRFDFTVGLGAILLALTFKLMKDSFLRMALDLPTYGWFANTLSDLPTSIAWISILVILLLSIWLIRLLTKRVTIKY